MSPAAPTPDAPRAPTEAELRELAVRGEQVRQQLTTLETQREYVLELVAEARRSLGTLEAMANAKAGDEVLVPLGAGAYVHATLAQPGKAITSLGSGVHAETTVQEAVERLRARAQNYEAAATTLGRDIARLSDEMGRLNAIAESIYGG